MFKVLISLFSLNLVGNCVELQAFCQHSERNSTNIRGDEICYTVSHQTLEKNDLQALLSHITSSCSK